MPAVLVALALQASPELQAEVRDLGDAMANIDACKRSIVPSTTRNVVNTCHGEWKGIRYTLTESWRFELEVPNAQAGAPKWSIWCADDKVESIRACSLFYTSNFRVLRTEHGSFVSWGSDPYPGAEKIVKFGDTAPARLPADYLLSASNSDLVLKGMHLAPKAYFRWYTWPEKLPATLEVDLADFKDVSLFFRAAHVKYASAT